MNESLQPSQVEIPENTLKRWQNIVDIMAELIGIPSVLILRLVESKVEVFISSRNDGNPFHPGDHEQFLGSALYYETVKRANDKLLVPNALADDKWKNNADIKHNFTSYLGYPVFLPDGKPFGTICVLDYSENAYSETYENLIKNFRDIIQYQLELIYMNNILAEKNRSLIEYLEEIKILTGFITICSYCKKIRGTEGKWCELEAFFSKNSEIKFSHSFCPECREKYYCDLL